jgi:glycosyltransferase 2 family protein
MSEESIPSQAPKKKLTRTLSMIAALLIAGICLYLAFRGVDWGVMWSTASKGRYELILLVSLISSVNLFIRAARWRILLSTEKPISVLTVFWANCTGYFGNNFLPARAGELIRAAAVGQVAGIGVGYSLATALTERIMDAVLLVLISLTAIFSLNNLPAILVNATRSMALVGLVGLVGVIMAPRLENQIKWVINKLPLPLKFKAPIISFLERFLLGMRALQNPRRLFGFLGLSAIIWSLDACSAMLVGMAFSLNITLALAFIILAALGLSSAVPSTPGYLGVYQVVAVAVMAPFGIVSSDALVWVITWQLQTYFLIGIWGGLGIWQLGISGKIFPSKTSGTN